MIILSLSKKQEDKRFNLWKLLNSPHLKDKRYLIQIKNVIREVIEEYSAYPCKINNIGNIPLLELLLVVSEQTFLVMMLMKIRTQTMAIASEKKKN